MFGVFKSSGPVCKHMPFKLIKKHLKIFFFTRNVNFYIFEPQKCSMNEKKNYLKKLISFASLKYSQLGLNSFNIIGALVRKNEFVKCSFIGLLKCILSLC